MLTVAEWRATGTPSSASDEELSLRSSGVERLSDSTVCRFNTHRISIPPFTCSVAPVM